LYSDLADYKVQKNQTTFVMNCARKAFYTDFISQNSINQRKLFQAAKILFTRRPDLMFPDPDVLANDIGEFFVQKIERIHAEFDSSALETNHSSVPEFTELTSRFDSFDILNEENVKDFLAGPNAHFIGFKMSRYSPSCDYQDDQFIITIWCVL
jgi:hypothetical protein